MSEQLAREVVVRWRKGEARRSRNRTRLYTDDAGRLKLGGEGGKTGVIPPVFGGTGHAGGAEPPLPAPGGVGYILASGDDGARVWVPLIAGAGISIERNPTTGAITISVTANIQTLTFGGDDLTWGGDSLTWGEA